MSDQELSYLLPIEVPLLKDRIRIAIKLIFTGYCELRLPPENVDNMFATYRRNKLIMGEPFVLEPKLNNVERFSTDKL